MEYSLDELIIAVMARYLTGEVLVGAVTAFGTLAGIVARHVYAPDLGILSSPESGLDANGFPTLTLAEFFAARDQGIPLTMEEVFDAIFTDHFRIWIHPAQIDRQGSVNISAIGAWERPKVALVGSRGIPEDTSHLSQLLYYILDHSPRTVVEHVDFQSGPGNTDRRATELGPIGSPSVLITNLGVFDFLGPEGTLRVISLHPEVSLETVRMASGFMPAVKEPLATTSAPTAAEIAVIRRYDPLKVRKLEWSQEPDGGRALLAAYHAERTQFLGDLAATPEDRPT